MNRQLLEDMACLLGVPTMPPSAADPQCVVDAMANLDLDVAAAVHEMTKEDSDG